MRLGRLLLCSLLGLLLLGTLLAPPASAAGRDPRWHFYTSDTRHYTSPWYRGAHRIMIPYGCTKAPYYDHDRRCRGKQGFHHGIDIAMPCGTPLYAARRLRVVSHRTLGPAYGKNPLLLRSHTGKFDLVIGHTRKVYVKPGQLVQKGTMIARANDSGAPDGCHLHFEKRAIKGGLSTATSPRRLLALTARRS